MQARVQKWGNSLAVRIPKSFAAQSQLEHNSLVEVTMEHGKIVILPLPKPKPSLAELLEGVTTQNIHDEVDAGQPIGREVW